MKIFVAIDDTDNIESRGTGELAELLSKTIKTNGWGEGDKVTRHQMLIHPKIPYTTHNSAMCFPADIYETAIDQFTLFAQEFLEKESADGSDPGLCIAKQPDDETLGRLIEFGQSAKSRVLEKKDAFDLAQSVNVHLSEHGGSGLGIIGALAGVGLRLTGNDGRFKGHFKIKPPGSVVRVDELKNFSGVDVIQSLEGKRLEEEEMVVIGEKVKAVLINNLANILVYEAPNRHNGAKWYTCTKQQLRKY